MGQRVRDEIAFSLVIQRRNGSHHSQTQVHCVFDLEVCSRLPLDLGGIGDESFTKLCPVRQDLLVKM